MHLELKLFSAIIEIVGRGFPDAPHVGVCFSIDASRMPRPTPFLFFVYALNSSLELTSIIHCTIDKRSKYEVISLNINTLLRDKQMTKYRLAKNSGVSQTTINDICSGKSNVKNCTGETLYRLAKIFDVSVEALISEAMECRPSFEIFKSNTCHYVKDMGDINFLIDTIKSDRIFNYLDRGWYREALYLLAMVDYLCRENELPLQEDYESLFKRIRENELESNGLLLEFEKNYSATLEAENIDDVIAQIKRKRAAEPQKDSLLVRLEEAKREAAGTEG